jgi:DNA-binding GntR family transcriptional regulator
MDTASYTGSDARAAGSLINGADPTLALPRLRRDHVYQELRRRIMIGEFALNSRLVEERLAALLGVSRTPVREALVRLLADGQVTRVDGGYFVATPDFSDLRDLYDLRITLELRGVARGLEIESVTHDASLLEPLRDQWRAMWDDRPDPAPDFVVVDEDFHVTLLRSAGNRVLTSTLQSVNARIRPVRMYDFLSEERIELTITQHLDVLERVLGGRLDEAVGALRAHVGESMEEVERRAARALTQMHLHRGGVR